MTEKLTYDPTPADAPEFTQDEQDSLAVAEKLGQEESELYAGKYQSAEELEEAKEGWMTLRIREASEVNGVRFPEGVKIDVHAEDAKKLLESKKAELISMKIQGFLIRRE